MSLVRSPVWGNVDRELLTPHGTEATWVEDYPSPCQLYAYTHDYGMAGCRHPGVDVTMPAGTPIHAIRAGVVTQHRPESYGTAEITVRDALGHLHLYTHQSRILAPVGSTVAEGQLISYSGAPTDLPHLHFEHRVPDPTTPSRWRIIDPLPLLTGRPQEPAMGFNIGNRPLRLAIGAGHANSSGGNAFERGINQQVTNTLLKLARASTGWDVRCWTPNEGLGMFNGPLDAAAATVRTWVAAGWRPDICIEIHQEGLGDTSVRGGHFIYPDARGLSGREACVPDYVDLDVQAHAGRMAELMCAESGVPTRYRPPRGMSERETGDGGQGYRLGYFGALSDCYFVENACVTISEGATYSNATDLAIMKRTDYPLKNATGILKALADLAKVRGNWTYPYTIATSATPGTPGGTPTDPQPGYLAPLAIPELDALRTRAVADIPAEVAFSFDGKAYLAVFVGDKVRAKVVTPRLQRPDARANARVGREISPTEPAFDVVWHISCLSAPSQPRVYRSPWSTIIRVADTVRVGDTLSTQGG